MTRFESYRRVLSVPGFPGVFLLGQVLKLPTVAAPVVLTLHTALGLGRGFGSAGLVVALWTLGVAVGAPVQGRFMDRWGTRPAFCVVLVAQAAFWGMATVLPFPLLVAVALPGGLLLVPGGTMPRVAISAMVPQEQSHTAYSLDSILTNLCALLAPAAAIVVATNVGTRPAMLCLGAVLVVTCACFVVRNPRFGLGAQAGRPARPDRLRRRELVMAFVCVGATGAMMSGSDLAMIATLRSVHQTTWAAAVMAACVASSFVGGLIYGARERAVSPAPLVACLGVLMVPIGLIADWRWMIVAFVPPALLVAPAFSASAGAAGRLAPSGARATVMSVYGASMMVGSSLGAPLAGVVFDHGAGLAGFAAVGCVGIAAGLVSRRALRAPSAPATPDGSGEHRVQETSERKS